MWKKTFSFKKKSYCESYLYALKKKMSEILLWKITKNHEITSVSYSKNYRYPCKNDEILIRPRGVGWGMGGALKEPWVTGRTFGPRRTRAYLPSATLARGVARQQNSKNSVGGRPKRALGRGANILPAENARWPAVGNGSEGRCTPKKFRKWNVAIFCHL